jgi:hypothetical protein
MSQHFANTTNHKYNWGIVASIKHVLATGTLVGNSAVGWRYVKMARSTSAFDPLSGFQSKEISP